MRGHFSKPVADDYRELTMTRRAELLASACRDVARMGQGRLQTGMAVAKPPPRPDSTRELLHRLARRGQCKSPST